MNKNDLIQKLADHTGLAKNDAAKAVDGVFDLIAASLKGGDEVRLTGFGVFVVATRAGGKGRNPQTGEEITIKPSKQPRFRAGKQLKDSLTRRADRTRCRADDGPRGIVFLAYDGISGRLAQLVEHIVYTDRVGGSSPSPPTICARPALMRNAAFIASMRGLHAGRNL